MERTDALRALRTKRRYIAAGLLLGLAVAALLNWSAERLYGSTSQFLVGVAPSTPEEGRDPYGDQQFSQQRAISYVQVLTGRELAQQVVDELALPITAPELTEMITATPLPDTVILEVTVTDTSPERAQAIAASVGQRFISRVQQLETPEGSASPTVEVKVMEPPTYEPTPVSPATERTLALGGALGLLLGFALAILSVRMDRSLRSEEEAAAVGGTEILGRVPADRQVTQRHVASGAADQSAVAEAFRTIRVNLQHLGPHERPRVVVVAGAMPGEGASTVAVNLALSLARSGSRVLLIDADLRRPRVVRKLDLPSGPGLTDVLTGDAELHEITRPWTDGTLTVLDAGPLPADPAEQLGSPAMRSLLKSALDEHDYVIVDAPPLLSVVDGAVLSALADGCLVVARLGRTSQDQLAEATSAITRVHGNVLGVVLNQMQAPRTRSRRKNYAADTDRRHARRPAGPAAPPLDKDADSGTDRRPDADTEPEDEVLPITGPLPPSSPRAGRPAEAWSGSAPPGPGTSPPAAT